MSVNNNPKGDGGVSAGTYIQLAAIGAEDIPLIRKPEMTFFKNVYRRHAPFSLESISNVFVETPRFGSSASVIIKKDAEMISKMYLTIDLPYDENLTNTYWTNRIGFNLLKKYELYIGRYLVQKQYGQWVHIWNELNRTVDEKSLLNHLVGDTGDNGQTNGPSASNKITLNIPIHLFFTDYITAFPLIKLYKNTQVKIKFYFEKKVNCIQTGTVPSGDLSNGKLWVDYIFLDTEERKNIFYGEHKILFNSLQFFEKTILSSGVKSIHLPFKYNSKELFWVAQKIKENNNDKFTNFTDDNGNSNINSIQFKLDTKKIYSSKARDNTYFNYIMPYKHHKGYPDLGINCHSFAIYPELNRPSGDLELTNISRFTMDVNIKKNCKINIYNLYYNMLTFKDGEIDLLFKV